MALDVADADILKSNVMHLLLQHPQGIKYGNFSGAFYQLHGHHLQLALHGYNSLEDFLTGMKNVVVLGKNSQTRVIKIVYGTPLNHCPKERKGLDNLMDEEADGFVLIRDAVGKHRCGLKLRKLKWILNEKHGFDLEKFRISRGYGNTLSFLEDIPGLLLQKSQKLKNCVIQLQSVLAAASVPILDILGGHPNGLDIQTLKEDLKKRGVDLENFSQDMGYSDPIDCLLDMPGLHLTFLYGEVPSKCVVQLLSHRLGFPALTLNAGSPLHKPLSSSSSGILPQKLMDTKPGPAEILALLSNLLNICRSGVTIKKMQTFLLTLNGLDLEKFSIAQGYKGTLALLEHQMPGLKIKHHKNILKIVVLKKAASLSSTASQLHSSLPLSSECSASESKTVNQNQLRQKPAQAKVFALVTNLLNICPRGLRVKQIQTFLLTLKGFDLEKFSIAEGYKDTLALLEHQMPELKIKYRKDRLKCVVKHTAAVLHGWPEACVRTCQSGEIGAEATEEQERVQGAPMAWPSEVLVQLS